MTATADHLTSMPRNTRQSGIALLQVLLLGAIISILALRFTQTARDQLEISLSLDSRVRAQLAVHSVMNEFVFLHLVDSFEMTSAFSSSTRNPLDNSKINFFGKTVLWSNGAYLRSQDLSGLLPQRYPEQPLWRRVLLRMQLSELSVDRYLGDWTDFQDADRKSWLAGDSEPEKLASGHPYSNLPAQTNKVLKWVFSDRKPLSDRLLEISDVRAPYETNLLLAPSSLLKALFDKPVVDSIIRLREERSDMSARSKLRSLLPSDIDSLYLSGSQSNLKRVHVEVSYGAARWEEERLIKFDSNSVPPFKILLVN